MSCRSAFQIVLFVFLIVIPLSSHGQIKSGELEMRNKLENEIQKNLTDLIATRLDRSTFAVAARVSVKEAPKGKKGVEPKKSEELPAGMDIGPIDVREIIASYERRIDELKTLKEEQMGEESPKFVAARIQVVVGLDDSFDEKYRAEFGAWLAGRIKYDYGAIATSEVNSLKFVKPIAEEKPGQQNSADHDPLKRDFPLVVAAILMLLGMILLGILVRSGIRSLVQAQPKMTIEPKGDWNIKGLDFDENKERSEPNNLPEVAEPLRRIGARDLEHILGKIAFVCMELGGQVNELVRVWVDGDGDKGFIKAALLIDTIMAAREKIMTATGTLPALQIPLDQDMIESQEENFAEGYRTVSNMDDYERLTMLEDIYWDLISVKTLGLQSLRRPFDFLQSLPNESLKEVLQTQGDDTRALALMYLPQEIKLDYLGELSDADKEKLILHMLNRTHVTQKQIWDVDTAVKMALINQSANPTEKLINLFPRTVEVLQTLDCLSEIRMLKRVAPSLPEQGHIIKQQYTTLAFLSEWRPEYIKRLVSVATSQELVVVCTVLQDAQSIVLQACSEKVRMIVEDDLRIDLKLGDRELSKTLDALKVKWIKIATTESIPMSKVISARKPEVALAA